MQHHAFNIGRPHVDAWWHRHTQLGIISTGFDGARGDRGDDLLHQLEEGDWILAYSNGHGFVGAGIVGPVSSYRLLPTSRLPVGWESDHRHLRGVTWIYAVTRLTDGIPADQVGRQAPRQTRERLPEDTGKQLIQLLASRAPPVTCSETLTHLNQALAERVSRSAADSSEARRERLNRAPKLPVRVPVLACEFVRNADVVAEVLFRANGQCERCRKPGPFLRRTDSTPYLEVHHKTQLAVGGEDTLENAIALCPNCHRELHYGAGAV